MKPELIGFDLSAFNGKPLSFLVSSDNDSASVGQDYVAVTSQPVSINAGDLYAEILIFLLDDLLPESTEKFRLYKLSPLNVVINEPDYFISIQKNDILFENFMFLPILLR